MIELFYPRRGGRARPVGVRPCAPVLPLATAALAALLALWSPRQAQAQMTVIPYVDARVEHDSNVFRVPNSQTLLLFNGDSTLGDTDERYVAGLNGTYQWDQQVLTTQLEARRQTFDHYTELDHNEYLADLNFKWKLTHLLDGQFEFRQERAMAPFALGNSNLLTIDLDRMISGKMNVNVSPDWRVETGVYSHTLYAPLLYYPDFVEHDLGSHLALDYVGISNFTYGLAFDRIDGNLENAPNVGPFTQNGAQLTMNYTVSALTKLNAAAGYSRRDQTVANGGNVSAFTGNLGYTRQVTGKTSVNLQLTRAINTYVAAGGSEIDTTASAGVTWQATYKLAATATYSLTHSTFVGQSFIVQGVPGLDTNGRVDRMPGEIVTLNYQALQRLLLRAYYNHQSRASVVEFFNFNDTTYGIEAKWTFQ